MKRPASSSDGGGVGGDPRDRYSPKTPPKGVAAQLAVPEPVPDEVTGRYEGDELAELRALRPMNDRVARLEAGQDETKRGQAELTKSFTDFRVEVAEHMGTMAGKVGELAGEVKGLAVVVKQKRDEEHVRVTTTLEVDKAKKISDVNVKQAEDLDRIAARKAKRDFYFKMAGSGAIGAVVLKLLQHWGVL